MVGVVKRNPKSMGGKFLLDSFCLDKIDEGSTLYSPSITVGHSNFLEPTLILIMRINVGHINFQPTLNL